jgi:hypothetical protein
MHEGREVKRSKVGDGDGAINLVFPYFWRFVRSGWGSFAGNECGGAFGAVKTRISECSLV